MKDTPQETILVQQGLHWGIFIPPLLVTLGFGLLLVPLMIWIHLMAGAMGQFSSRPGIVRGEFLVLVPFVLLGVVMLVATLMAYLKSNITLTDRRLVFRTGLFVRTTGEIPLENVEAIILAEPLLGRVLGYGTVMATSLGGLRVPMRFIASPQDFHSTLQKAVATVKTPPKAVERTGTPGRDDDSRYMPKS